MRAKNVWLWATWVVLCWTASTWADVWTYPAPGQASYRSPMYRCHIREQERATESFVYHTLCTWHHSYRQPWTAQHFSADNHWTSFSFTGQVTVVVDLLVGDVRNVELRPDPDGTAAAVVNGQVIIQVSRPGQYFVCINGEDGMEHPFFLFANPPEDKVPAEGTAGVHYFGPGVHKIGDKYRVGAGETVYLAGGALVQGSIHYEGDGVRICGRGILSDRVRMKDRIAQANVDRDAGDKHPWNRNHDAWYAAKVATIYGSGSNTVVEGITVIDSPFYMVRLDGPGTTVRNVKLISDIYNNNGIIAGPRHQILDSFFKVEDDVFCWMAPLSLMRGNVIWKQTNACVCQLGYGYAYTTSHHLFLDNAIIVDQTAVQSRARAIFGLASSAGTEFMHCRIENLKIYGDILNLLAIDNWWRPTPWSMEVTDDVQLRTIKLHLKNIEVTGTERGSWWGEAVADLADRPMASRLRTEGDGSIDVTFENVRINGRLLRSDADWPNGLIKQGNVITRYLTTEDTPAQ